MSVIAILQQQAPVPRVRRVLFCFDYGSQRFDSDIERVRHRQHGRMV